MGNRRASCRPSRPRHPRARSDRDRNLSARQRQGRRLFIARATVALVCEIGVTKLVMAGPYTCPGHPRLASATKEKDVDARHKAGHDEKYQYPPVLLASLLVCTRSRLFSILPSI